MKGMHNSSRIAQFKCTQVAYGTQLIDRMAMLKHM